MTTELKKSTVEPLPCCGICAEPYTTVVRKRVECSSCHKDLCTKCIEKYLLSTIDDPHCMYCRTAWPRSFLNTACTNTFLNKTYYAHRQTILVNREKSYLPNYQLAAERTLRIRDLTKQDKVFQDEITALEARHRQEIAVVSQRRTDIWRRMNRINQGQPETGGVNAEATTRAAATKFVRRCTATDCNGFLSSVWKCGICHVWVCPDCFEVKGADKDTPHTCSPEMLQTAALIRKDTKPCPSCGEMISKIDGCDQMWCISCHTPFSWITGQAIKTGIVHNPHYFQWLAKGGQPAPTNPGFIPCGGLPNVYRIQRALQNASKEDRKDLLDILRVCNHVGDVDRPRYERHLNPINNEEVGVKFLLKETDEDGWKTSLGRQEKDRQKSNEIRDILDAFYGAAIDLFRRIDPDTATPYTKEEATNLIVVLRIELEALRKHIFQSMLDVSKSFHCAIPFINEKWEMEHGLPSNIARRKRLAEEEREKEKLATAATVATATVATTAATAATATTATTATIVADRIV